ncbi:MAG: CarD family transcriptional regulator [Eubacteriales bacterium]|jgi:CarD family transcriptional regulator|nr:CarD family transcriptional regulator [Eubacteriales bacterium]
MRYRVNDTVLHGMQGVFTIEDIADKEFNGTKSLYYVLKNVENDRSTVFVPVDNEAATCKMRLVLSTVEVYSLIRSMPDIDTDWIDNDRTRRERFKEIILKGNRTDLVRLIKSLHEHRKVQKEKGKRLNTTDERFMKDAEKVLYGEIAHVMDISTDEVLPFIRRELAAQAQ